MISIDRTGVEDVLDDNGADNGADYLIYTTVGHMPISLIPER